MSRILTPARIENLADLSTVREGRSSGDGRRRIDLADALVDLGLTSLALSPPLLRQLGLRKRGTMKTTSNDGTTLVNVYDPVRVTILGRDCTVDVLEGTDIVPVRIGRVPLLMMDLVVDFQSHRLIGNPAHDGEQVLELF